MIVRSWRCSTGGARCSARTTATKVPISRAGAAARIARCRRRDRPVPAAGSTDAARTASRRPRRPLHPTRRPPPPPRQPHSPGRRAATRLAPTATDRGGSAPLIFGSIILLIGLWFFATQTLGLDLPGSSGARPGRSSSSASGSGSSRPRCAERASRWRRRTAGARATAPRRTAPGWPTGAGGSPPCMRRSGPWPPRTRSIALAHWRAVREMLYREHPQSPVPPAAREAFRAAHFDHDPSLRFAVVVEPAPPPAPGALALELPNSGADTLSFSRVGRIAIPFARRHSHPVGLLDGGLRGRPVHPLP